MAAAQAKATALLLGVASEKPAFLASVEFGHDTGEDVYPSILVPHPFPWLLCNFGSLEIFSFPVSIAAILRKLDDPIMERVPGWSVIQSKLVSIGEGIEVECDKEKIGQFWSALIEGLVSVKSLNEPWLRSFWDSMAEDKLVPPFLPTADGKVPLADAHYTTSRDLARHARAAGLVVAEVSVATGKVWRTKGAKGLDDLFELDWDEGSGQDSRLVQAVPDVARVLKEGVGEIAVCRTVSGLKTRFGDAAGEVACVMWQGVLHMDLEQLQMLSRSVRLERILSVSVV